MSKRVIQLHKEPPAWMFRRANEIYQLAEALLAPYHIQSEDDFFQAMGAISYNSKSARFENRFFPRMMKIAGDMVDIPIPIDSEEALETARVKALKYLEPLPQELQERVLNMIESIWKNLEEL